MLARLFTFTAGSLIQSAQVNGELDQVVQLLNGTKLDTTQLKHNSAVVLIVDNTGGNTIAEFRVAGTAKSKVNAAGQFESLLATGTAPLVVASTTMVTNLNAEYLGGHTAAYYLGSTDPVINGGAGTAKLTLGTWADLRSTATTLSIKDGAAANLLTIDLATKAVAVFGALSGITPTAAAHLTRKDYVDSTVNGKKVFWSWPVFQPDGSTLTGVVGNRYVVPAGVSNFTARYLRCVVPGGAVGAGPPTATIRKYSGGVFVTASGSLSLTTGAGTDYVCSLALGAPITFNAGDVLEVTVTAGGSTTLTNLTWIAEGDYTLG